MVHFICVFKLVQMKFIFRIGHVWKSEDMGERAAAPGQSKHCDSHRRQQSRPRKQTDGGVRGETSGLFCIFSSERFLV